MGLFYLYTAENGYSPYVKGVELARFSKDELQKYVKEVGSIENLNIVKLTDQELMYWVIGGRFHVIVNLGCFQDLLRITG